VPQTGRVTADEVLLPPELLARARERAPGHDAANTFPHDDLDGLVASGYLRLLVPEAFGGVGAGLADAVRLQRRLAASAPATALAVGMHLVFTGAARFLHDRGDAALDGVLREAGEGHVFAFGVSEPGTDSPLVDSATDAAPLLGGAYAFTGTKVFTSLAPVWTRLATIGLDTTSRDAPKIVHAVIARDADGIEVLDDWDTIGMRATQSRTTRLVGAVAEPARVLRRLDPGPNPDPLLAAILVDFEILIAAVYTGIADRALELGVDAARSRVSRGTGEGRDRDPDARRRLAEAALAIDAVDPRLRMLAADVDARADHGDRWFRLATGLKSAAVATARTAVDQSVAVAGGSAFRSGSELARLHRDVMAGGFHPSTDDQVRRTVAASLLGPL